MYFTTYWKNQAWDRKAEAAAKGFPLLRYAASNRFSQAGVLPGSTLIVITVKKGLLFVAGTVKVDSVVDKRAAAAILDIDECALWQANEYAIAASHCVDWFRSGVSISAKKAASLRFVNGERILAPRFRANGELDRQTLRSVRCLARGAERLLLGATTL